MQLACSAKNYLRTSNFLRLRAIWLSQLLMLKSWHFWLNFRQVGKVDLCKTVLIFKVFLHDFENTQAELVGNLWTRKGNAESSNKIWMEQTIVDRYDGMIGKGEGWRVVWSREEGSTGLCDQTNPVYWSRYSCSHLLLKLPQIFLYQLISKLEHGHLPLWVLSRFLGGVPYLERSFQKPFSENYLNI